MFYLLTQGRCILELIIFRFCVLNQGLKKNQPNESWNSVSDVDDIDTLYLIHPDFAVFIHRFIADPTTCHLNEFQWWLKNKQLNGISIKIEINFVERRFLWMKGIAEETVAVTYTDKGIDNVDVVSCTPELHNDIGPLSNLSKLYLYGGGKNC